ncbi:zinc-containing alcohol dehydrogenase [Streptococcus pneumoniae]|nr:zinc-containing alcohol dehydrogenase [Streptococcus pneumoniae]
MKSAVYTKAGQVGLASIERPQIIEADDVIIRVVQIYGGTVIQKRKLDIKIVDTKRLGLLKKLGKPLRR